MPTGRGMVEAAAMARETKVGLLAGLAFIICFAIILANRGRQDLIPAQLTYLDRAHSDSPVERRASTASPSVDGHFGATVQPVNDPVVGRPPRRMPKSNPPRTDREVLAGPQSAPELSSGAKTTEGYVEQPVGARRDRMPPGMADAVPTNASDDTAEKMRILEKRLEELSREVRLESRSEKRPAKSPSTAPVEAPQRSVDPPPERTLRAPAELARHTVVAGDTLSAIATKFYGSKSRRAIDAVFDANRAVMSNPDELRVGMELVIPVVAGFERPATHPVARQRPPGHAPDSSDEVPGSRPRPFRWYQIQKNDRYISIAREQLGDAGRWREIYELNKAAFPEPGLIREGVRIKLPTIEMADGREGRH